MHNDNDRSNCGDGDQIIVFVIETENGFGPDPASIMQDVMGQEEKRVLEKCEMLILGD